MADNSTGSTKKSQLLIWLSVLLATILVIFVVVFILLKSNDSKSKDLNLDTLAMTSNQNPALNAMSISDFKKSFTGTRETLDGNIEAVLFEIKNYDSSNQSFEFTLNIGLSKKINGFGSVDLKAEKLSADVLGTLSISFDDNKRINLRTNDSLSNIKFNLIEEQK